MFMGICVLLALTVALCSYQEKTPIEEEDVCMQTLP